MSKLLKEAVFVGIVTVILGSIVGWGVSKTMKSDLPKVCKDWNNFYVMEISLFLTGFLIHIIMEQIGLNHWYCTNGNACLKK